MELIFRILVAVSSLLCLSYFVLIASYCYAWIKTSYPTLSSLLLTTKVSVIIAARNEENNIERCINSILQQNYPSQFMELIIVDDVSEDTTNDKIKTLFMNRKNVKLITLTSHSENSGKKNALNKGISQSIGELIVTTDADCIMDKNWLTTLVRYYQQTQAKMIVAPVVFYNEKSVFEKMQMLEFMSLIVCGGASLYYNKAIMCNGANLAYTRKVFDEIHGFEDINNNASGDDVLLMYKIKNKYSDGIKFLKHYEAMVFTNAKNNLKDFISQRKRWSSKSFWALNAETKKVSLIVYLFNLSLFMQMLSLLISAIYFHPNNLSNFFFLLFGIKCVIDFLLLFLAAPFFKKQVFTPYFLLEEFLYIVYVVFIGLIGLLQSKYVWKDRKTK
jgi:cellulose synthase/poly-beta-1,6-N-acetylglucosamine synthase-like glycosyltransferase